jgi:hypothetical protein
MIVARGFDRNIAQLHHDSRFQITPTVVKGLGYNPCTPKGDRLIAPEQS